MRPQSSVRSLIPTGFQLMWLAAMLGNGRIVMATSGSPFKHDSVSVCTLSGGCTANLKTPGMKYVLGVALAPNGDCWASGGSQMSGRIVGSLGYFAHCRGRGVAATGFLDGDPNGLDIDASGNLVSVSDDSLYVYSGCNPACTLLGGPFPDSMVSLGTVTSMQSSKHFVAADVVCGSGNVLNWTSTHTAPALLSTNTASATASRPAVPPTRHSVRVLRNRLRPIRKTGTARPIV